MPAKYKSRWRTGGYYDITPLTRRMRGDFVAKREAFARYVCRYVLKAMGVKGISIRIGWSAQLRTSAGNCRQVVGGDGRPLFIIKLSPHMVKDFRDAAETVAHEVAHALDWYLNDSDSGHGRAFLKLTKKIYEMTGIYGSRYHYAPGAEAFDVDPNSDSYVTSSEEDADFQPDA